MEPKVKGPNHFGGRIVFAKDGMLFLTLGERFKFAAAQDLSSHLFVVRINKDGFVPQDNHFLGDENVRNEISPYVYRNIESAAIDLKSGLLGIAEMGPMGCDEFNQPEAGGNYGSPKISWGTTMTEMKFQILSQTQNMLMPGFTGHLPFHLLV